MNKLICNAPHTSMFINQQNNIFPCCVFDQSKFGKRYTSIDEYLKSPELSDIKRKLETGIWPKGCHRCKYKQDIGIDNDADNYLNKIKKDNLDLNQILRPIYLDIRPGSDCNLKCRMCFPTASNLINEEFLKNPSMQKWHPIVNNYDFDMDQVIDFIQNNKIHTLKILGGEPTIDKNVFKLLNEISKYKKVQHLRFTTNATNLNKKFKTVISNFDKVTIHFSLDGVYETYNYIRTNANFKKVEKNIINIMREQPSFKYAFNIVLTPYNIFNLSDMLYWFLNLEKEGYTFHLDFNHSVANYTNLSAIKNKHRYEVIKEIEKKFSSIDTDLKIDYLITLLKNISHLKKNTNLFIKYNSELDNIRKTSLKKLDNRFVDYIE